WLCGCLSHIPSTLTRVRLSKGAREQTLPENGTELKSQRESHTQRM
ncbi:hypothetical protein LEMLEM_LOCUS548, partial [Lemmus lemmus]